MRRAPTWGGIAGVILVWAVSPAIGRAGVWVTLAAGLGGSPTAANEFWFDTPHGPPQVAINQLTPGFTAEAGTGGGTTFFSSAATPLLLNLSDGSAYVAAGTAPDAAKVPGGSRGGTGATGVPQTGQPIPTDAALLGITLSDPDAAGRSILTAMVTDVAGKALGTAAVNIPSGGWWVIGLSPADKPGTGGGTVPGGTGGTGTDPGPIDGGGVGGTVGYGGTGGDPGPVGSPPPPTPPPPTTPPPPPTSGGGTTTSPTTPEPSTAVLLGLGAGFASGWSRLRRKK
jgi:kumamolisin